ncbi:MAG: hypothetical protein ACLQVL_22550 [Terriglobia bacterium]
MKWDKVLWERVFDAMQRAAALSIFGAMHYGFNKGLEFVVPKGFERTLLFMEGFVFLLFLMIYLHFAWDMVTVFIPVLRSAGEKEEIQNETRADRGKAENNE